MSLYKKLDYWSVLEGIEKVMEYEDNGNEKGSRYWDYYREQIWEMSILAAEMWEELDEIKNRLGYCLPSRKIEFCGEDECKQTAIAWWNTAACMLSDTDMRELLERENIYMADEFEEKQKRIRAFGKLTKKQQMILWTDVIGFITRYLELMATFETISAVIHELNYHHPSAEASERFSVSDMAYL